MKAIKTIIIGVVLLYAIACMFLYFVQEKLIFFPTVLPKDYQYNFTFPFEEINLKTADSTTLNSLLFKSENSKGVVLFFHGNGGDLHNWGQKAHVYLNNNYDVLFIDYRGYGKSDDKITSESQLINDGQIAYDFLKKYYPEINITISGTSIGTGIASIIAAQNNPKQLLLNAPYFSLKSLIKEKVPTVPSFVIKYYLESYLYLPEVTCPITIFHGTEDEVIPVHHSKKLKETIPTIDLHLLEGLHHNDLTDSNAFYKIMKEVLN